MPAFDREHLTTDEVERLIAAAKRNRHGRRDALMILLTFRHALRASEVAIFRWEQVDFKAGPLHVRRVKNGTPSTHPLTGSGDARAAQASTREDFASPFVFVSERGAPLTAPGFSRMVERAGSRPISASRCTPTCSGTPAAISSRATAATLARSSRTSAIATSRIRHATRRWRTRSVQGFLERLVKARTPWNSGLARTNSAFSASLICATIVCSSSELERPSIASSLGVRRENANPCLRPTVRLPHRHLLQPESQSLKLPWDRILGDMADGRVGSIASLLRCPVRVRLSSDHDQIAGRLGTSAWGQKQTFSRLPCSQRRYR